MVRWLQHEGNPGCCQRDWWLVLLYLQDGYRFMLFSNLLHLTVQTYFIVSVLLLPVFLVAFENKLRFPNYLNPQTTCIRGILVFNTDSENLLHSSLSQCFYILEFAELRRNRLKFIHLHQKLEVVWTNIISLSLFP